jgi:hypothetical protein
LGGVAKTYLEEEMKKAETLYTVFSQEGFTVKHGHLYAVVVAKSILNFLRHTDYFEA